MRELGRRGGVNSGKTRRLNRAVRIIEDYGRRKHGIAATATGNDREQAAMYEVWEITGRQFTLDQIAEAMRPAHRRGGSHDTDWRCPECHCFNSIRSHRCRRCKRFAPANGRMTRAALRERAAEHRTTAILR
ncbi:MAG: hypothetical protein ABSH47_12420 [Bryobacteraceae bacterium]|jgi:hypothetical protein